MSELHSAGPAEAAKWRFARRRAYAVFLGHGYREVQPSPIDPAGTAEVAGSGPFLAIDGGELRSDPLVSVARVFAQSDEKYARWMTAGNAFDPEPVGPLRWSTWHAVSGGVFGAAEPAADAEVAALCLAFANDLGLTGAEVVLSTLGDAADVARFVEATTELRPLRCNDCRASSAQLRFLTCEDDGCKALALSAPPLRQFVSVAALKHHESVLATLEASGFTVRDDPRLGFGADRYSRTLIELRARDPQGTELTLARGGRRDGLVQALGGKPTPAVGLTLGLARTASCLAGEGDSYETGCEIFIAARGTAARAWALKVASAERGRGFRVDVDLRDLGWADQLMRAERVRARVVLVVGDVERKKGEVAIRDMSTRETKHIKEEQLPAELKRILR